MSVNKYLITCQTCFYGCDAEFGIESDDIGAVAELADQLAYENFYFTFDCAPDALSDNGYHVDEMSDEEFEEACIKLDEGGYHWWSTVEEFTGTEEEWNNLEKVSL